MTRIVNDIAAGRFLVPRRAFTDHAVFEREYAAIFDRCWLYLGHASELASPGAYLTRKVARRPILFTRDKGGEFHALFNACPHRGAMVCRERNGKSPAFMCMYHGWTFASDGHLMTLPGASGYPEGFKTDPQKQMVHVPRLARHGDFFFISFATLLSFRCCHPHPHPSIPSKSSIYFCNDRNGVAQQRSILVTFHVAPMVS